MLIGICLFALAVVVAARPVPQDETGERLVNRACTTCHDLRRIQTQALDADGWSAVIKTMIEKGATVTDADRPIILNYLVSNHGPLSEGAGKEILLNTCTLCHDLKRVKEHGATRQQWEETLQAMLNEGAPLSDEEFPVILAYLARNFRPVQ
jgi:cytochrome c5